MDLQQQLNPTFSEIQTADSQPHGSNDSFLSNKDLSNSPELAELHAATQLHAQLLSGVASVASSAVASGIDVGPLPLGSTSLGAPLGAALGAPLSVTMDHTSQPFTPAGVTDAHLSAFQPTGDLSAFQPTGVSPFQSTGDLSSFQPTGDLSAFQPPGDLSPFQPTGDLSAFQQAGELSAFQQAGELAAFKPVAGQIEIKLFVGRLPTSASEDSIRPLFAEFGEVVEVVVIRDKSSAAHKGSAFVRMASIAQADAAIRALHNTRVVDPSLGPLQISYATGEAERLAFTPGSLVPGEDEAKLFIGSLPRDVTEQDVEAFFSRFGRAYDAYLMRDTATKRFKGCGFVKFAMKEEAIAAIKQLHGVVTFPGAARPLEVRIAEPKRPAGSVAAGRVLQNTAQSKAAVARQSSYDNQQQPSNANPRSAGPWKEYFTADGRPYYHNDQLGITQWEVPLEFLAVFPGRDAGDVTGPPGANIFIFHVPNEWGKDDLAAHFAPFGYILSAKVAVDHSTNRNKGYGFVSYDSVRSALHAVQQMNLMAVGNKRLRVAIKNGEEEAARSYADQNGLFNMYPTAATDLQLNAASIMNFQAYPQAAQAVGSFRPNLSQLPAMSRSLGIGSQMASQMGSQIGSQLGAQGLMQRRLMDSSLGGQSAFIPNAGINAFVRGYTGATMREQRFGQF